MNKAYKNQSNGIRLEVFQDKDGDWCYEVKDLCKPGTIEDCSVLDSFENASRCGEESFNGVLAKHAVYKLA